MLKPYESVTRLITIVLPFIVMAGIPLPSLIAKQNTGCKGNNKKEILKDTVQYSPEWMDKAIDVIKQQEYNIAWSLQDSTWKSPNKAQNFRLTFKPGMVALQSRVQSDLPDDHWTLDLKLEQIRFDEQETFYPDKNAVPVLQNNKISFEHKKSFTIEYINTEKGLRQNFIIHKIPGNLAHSMNVRLRVAGSVKAEKVNDGEVHFSAGGLKEKNLIYNDLHVWDATGKKLKAWMDVPDESTVEIKVDAENAELPVTIDPLITSVSDWAVYGNSDDRLGTSIACAGDVNNDGYSDIMISSTRFDGTYTDEGAVYIYHGSAIGPSNTPAIILTGGTATGQGGSNFGASVSTAGDINGDGCSDIIIGAPDYDNGGNNRGAAFIFYGSTTAGITTAGSCMLTGVNVNDNFGISVSGAGDINGDHFSDIVIGAPGYDVAVANDERGAAFIYRGSNAGITSGSAPAQILQGPNVANESGTWYFDNSDLFGAVVAGAGDVNGDGYSDVLVAATQYEEGIGDNASDDQDEGAVYVYNGGASGLNGTAAIVLEGNRDRIKFGVSMGTAGDVNGDGYCDIVVASPDYSIYPGNGGTVPQYGGAVFIFSGSAAGITGSVTNAGITGVTVYGNVPFQRLGTSARCAGDVNGDGFADVIIGATTYDNNRAANGSASGGTTGNMFIFYGRGGFFAGFVASTNTLSLLNIQSTQTNAEFGASVSSAGDMNGDGFSDIIVGATLYDNGAVTNSGCVYAFNGGGAGLSYTPAVMKERNQVNANLGISVASAGDVNGDGLGDVIVGANLWDNGVTVNTGAFFIYHGLNNGGINNFSSPASPLIGAAGSNFGISVASAGDVNGDGYSDVIVGANLAGAAGTGVAYIYHGSATGISLTPSKTITGINADDNFGISVSSAGDINWDGYSDIIIGANLYESSPAETNEGAAFIYYGSATGINTVSAPQHRLERNQANANFGISVSHAGDVNQDGWSDVIVGADQFDNGETDEGAAFVYHGTSYGINSAPSTILEPNQVNAHFGTAVAYAGDVNGDSYSDVIAGAYLYDNAQTDAGAAFIYHGTAGGLNNSPALILPGVNANDHFGISVSSAGDVNGDGYDDVMIGANLYENGQADEGGVFVFHGSNTGINPAVNVILESNLANANFGISVAVAGDLNGDGFSDALAGASTYDGGQAGEGRFFIHLGNNKTVGSMLINRPKSRNTGSASFITASNLADLNFGIELLAKSPLGNQTGKFIWETRGSGQAWSTNSSGYITNSITSTAEQPGYSTMTSPVLFSQTAGKVIFPYYGLTRARMRIRYELFNSLTGQIYGPWRYIDRYGAALIAAQPYQPLPLSQKIKSFNAIIDRCDITLHWKTLPDLIVKQFIIESSKDGQLFSNVGLVMASANTGILHNYSFKIRQATGKMFYRLKILDVDGKADYSRCLSAQSHCNDNSSSQCIVYPNPVKMGNNITVGLSADSKFGKTITAYVTDMTGIKYSIGQITVEPGIANQKTINTVNLAKGTYLLELMGATGYTEVSKFIVVD